MFSPTVRPARAGIFRHVMGLDSPATSEPPPEPPSELQEDDLAILDPAKLSGEDEAALYELQDLEEHFDMYTSAPFNPALLHFVSSSEEPSAGNPLSILACLSPTDPETRHVSYRLRGLQSLLSELRAILCYHPGLIAQRDDLIDTANLEIEQMVSNIWNERETQLSASASVPGIRRVSVDNRPVNPYASPLATSAIILTAVIHAIMGVARVHCGFILSSLRALISMAFQTQNTWSTDFIQQHINDIPLTLPTALYRLNLSPAFDLYACCPECSRLYLQSKGADNSLPTHCINRNLDGVECGAELSTTHRRGAATWQKPIRRYSHMRFETWVSELLLRPGIEDLLKATRPNPNPGAAAADVWDAPYLRTFPGHGQPNFMDASVDELRLVMMLHFDFFNPFEMKEAGKKRSIGCFFMICLNLPPDIRYSPSNSYLVSVVPGPSEAKFDELNHFIKPIVDDMLEIYAPGIWVSRTHKYPHGRRVRAAIAIKSMDILAARGSGGFASHSHNCFCNLCTAKRVNIDSTSLEPFQLRTITAHREQVTLWENAGSLGAQQKIYDRYGVRNVDWLKFPWWDPFTSIVVGPMHWTKNILDKQLRKNMNWSWTQPAGLPNDIPYSIPIISTLEYDWGTQAFLGLDETGFKNAKLTAPLLRYLCRQRGIFEAGFASHRLIDELNQWRKSYRIISADGARTQYAINTFGDGRGIGMARAHYYVSRHPPASHATISQNSTVPDLRALCETLHLDSTGQKEHLIGRLQSHYESVRVPMMTDIAGTTKPTKTTPKSLLGFEVLREVKQDMSQTILPSWLKHPPINFATVNHGKLQSEEYKSLALVSFTITLVRLWGLDRTDVSLAPLRERLDNFLHLMLAVRILAFQSITELDITAFELHYRHYLESLKRLYPSCTLNCNQHLGLHIPRFMRSLGPSTRWSESTCEQFIGMFQNITTNFKFGDLELTLHREFIMASRLKGLLERGNITASLGAFGEVVQNFLQQHVPGQIPQAWQATHGNNPTLIPDSVHEALTVWSDARSTRVFPRSLFLCSSISLGNVVYSPFTASNGNSCVLFSPAVHTPELLPGRVEFIIKEPETLVATGKPRIVLIVRPFRPLNERDSLHDPYLHNPVIGGHGAGIAQLYYDDLEAETHLIEPRDLVSHIAICPYTDPEGTLSRSAIVVLSLDLKHERFA